MVWSFKVCRLSLADIASSAGGGTTSDITFSGVRLSLADIASSAGVLFWLISIFFDAASVSLTSHRARDDLTHQEGGSAARLSLADIASSAGLSSD